MNYLNLLTHLGASFASERDTSCRDVPIEHQLSLLGLEGKFLEKLKGKKVLDLACGNGSLVRHLRGLSIEAHGIDPRAPSEDYFTRRKVFGFGKIQGFPVDEGTYDAIVSFQNVSLNMAFDADHEKWAAGNHPDYAKWASDYFSTCVFEAQCMVSEMGRTLKPGAKAVIFPYLGKFELNTRLMRITEGLAYEEVKCRRKNLLDYRAWEDAQDGISDATAPKLEHRIVLTKK